MALATKRKTRIVCISDTHNNTPKLPPGDVLIHAGDLTNQGSWAELQRSVAWLESAPFEAKIVVAGNHEITLDERFYEAKGARWKWPAPQSPRGCAKLLREARSIVYLENSAATVYLRGPKTKFRVFGSPGTPGRGEWAFEYQEQDAERLWAGIPEDADVVVTHTPAMGHCDAATKDNRSGCAALLQRLAVVRPMLHVCGHIHEARGVERVVWSPSRSDSLVASVERWQDPGRGNKKLSLLDLTGKSGRPLGNSVAVTRQTRSDSLQRSLGSQPCLSTSEVGVLQPGEGNSNPTSSNDLSLIDCALPGSEAHGNFGDSGVMEGRPGGAASRTALHGDSGRQSRSSRYEHRIESAIINAAFLGPRVNGRMTGTNKPIVVDIDLPVWTVDEEMDMCDDVAPLCSSE